MSLGPLGEYIARMTESHGPPRPTMHTCNQCGADIGVWSVEKDEVQQVSCGTCGWTITVREGS